MCLHAAAFPPLPNSSPSPPPQFLHPPLAPGEAALVALLQMHMYTCAHAAWLYSYMRASTRTTRTWPAAVHWCHYPDILFGRVKKFLTLLCLLFSAGTFCSPRDTAHFGELSIKIRLFLRLSAQEIRIRRILTYIIVQLLCLCRPCQVFLLRHQHHCPLLHFLHLLVSLQDELLVRYLAVI